jgi:hypothetical protein
MMMATSSHPVTPLSPAEIAAFKRDGYIIRRGVLEGRLLRAARDRLWAGNTSATLRRHEPATYNAGFGGTDRCSDPSGMNDRSSQYSWRLRSLGGDAELIDLLPRRVWPWLVQLVGRGQALVEPECTASAADPDPSGSRLRGWNFYGGKELRGCYCVLPQPRTSSSMEEAARAGAHQDPPPKHLVACALLESVPAGGGGMAVFPGSHKLLFEHAPASVDPLATTQLRLPHPHDGAGGTTLHPSFQPAYEACLRTLRGTANDDHDQPCGGGGGGGGGGGARPWPVVEFCGGAGDVMLMHGRLFHSATPNCVPNQMRQMVLYDVVTQSVHDRYYAEYVRGARPSMPPNIRRLHGLEQGPPPAVAAVAAVAAEGGLMLPCPQSPCPDDKDFWADWSEEVQSTPELAQPAAAKL